MSNACADEVPCISKWNLATCQLLAPKTRHVIPSLVQLAGCLRQALVILRQEHWTFPVASTTQQLNVLGPGAARQMDHRLLRLRALESILSSQIRATARDLLEFSCSDASSPVGVDKNSCRTSAASP
jgi:hypothetical protein